jgi:hypothetical protein
VERFLGDWVDDAGRLLRIEAPGGVPRASFYRREDGKPVRRKGFFCLLRTAAVALPAKVDGDRLVIELDEPGLGPTMRLRREEEDGRPVLVPEVGVGLYGDWEEDLGVPWVFPLSVYRRA